MGQDRELLDLLVVGAGPTGIAIGAEARQQGLSVLVVDQGALVASLQAYPTDLEFFTTRERLEIAGIPFAIPDIKPNRRQALVYYREVVRRHQVPLALHERVLSVRREEASQKTDGEVRFVVTSEKNGATVTRAASAVAFATGYFWWPNRLGVPGEEAPWVQSRYAEPYAHFDQDVTVVGGGNSAAKTALDLWRNGARVTLIHRREQLKKSIKYWIKPDIENRIAEGSIRGLFNATVRAFRPASSGESHSIEVEIARRDGTNEALSVPADTAYVLIGYRPNVALFEASGIEIEGDSLIPTFDPKSCETNIPGLYVAGTIQAGRHTDRIFIENSRDHGERIVSHLRQRLR